MHLLKEEGGTGDFRYSCRAEMVGRQRFGPVECVWFAQVLSPSVLVMISAYSQLFRYFT